MSVSSPLRLSGSVLVTGSRRTGWPDTVLAEEPVSVTVNLSRTLIRKPSVTLTSDERTVGSHQRVDAGSSGDDLHPEATVFVLQNILLCGGQRWGGRLPVAPHGLHAFPFCCVNINVMVEGSKLRRGLNSTTNPPPEPD